MPLPFLLTTATTAAAKRAVPLFLVAERNYPRWLKAQDSATRTRLTHQRFAAKPHTHALLYDAQHRLRGVAVGVGNAPSLWDLAALPRQLPEGSYQIDRDSAKQNYTPAMLDKMLEQTIEHWALGWQLGGYQCDYFTATEAPRAMLALPAKTPIARITSIADAIAEARTHITLPANIVRPHYLEKAAQKLARAHRAALKTITGDALLKANYPLIHAVGRASDDAPRLIDLRWGNARHPKVTLVGKGVCFDSGGLDIKPASGMKLMKKDMGGAACVLALAQIIMEQKLPVRLRVLIPAVENSISANAFRPMDVIASHKGLKVEIGNTDAEGRLILADALAEADSEGPDVLIDCATLTGAARTALGTDIPAFMTRDDAFAKALEQAAHTAEDPLWRLPLWPGYEEMLRSDIADINSAPESPYAGAITAGLFLGRFVERAAHWVHIDMMAWNLKSRPGRPAGGEAMAVRALFTFLQERYGKGG